MPPLKSASCLAACLALAGCTAPDQTTPSAAPKPSTLATAAPPLDPTWRSAPGPGFYINSVAITRDGGRVVGGTFYHKYSLPAQRTGPAAAPAAQLDPTGTYGTYCYDRTGNVLWKDEFVGWQGVYWVDISTDGAWAASGGWYVQVPQPEGFVRAYNAATGQTVLNYFTNGRVNQVSLSADGTWLVAAAKSLFLFQRINGTYQLVDQFSTTATDTMETIALSQDGQTLVAGNYGGTSGGSIMMFNIQGGKLGTPTTWPVPGGGYSHSVRITPDGSAFAAGGSGGKFYFFKTAQFKSTGQPTGMYDTRSTGSIYGVTLADDGSTFVGIANSTSGTGRVFCVTSATQALKWTFPTLHNPNSAHMRSQFNLLAVADGHPDGSPGAFYLLSASTGTLIGQYNTTNMSWPIMIAAGGQALVAGSDDSNIYYFNVPPAAAAKR